MTQRDFQKVYQFKVVLQNAKPPIWRRIQVPESYSFWDLHVAIQDAMGWNDSHLHSFVIRRDKKQSLRDDIHIGIPSEDDPYSILSGWETPIKKYYTREGQQALYWYDFGDDWKHTVLLEKILPVENSASYPKCLAGKRACPPDDCGGVWGYEDMIETLKNKKGSQYKELVEWLGLEKGEEFDSETFNPAEVVFDNTKERLKLMMSYK